MSTKISGEYYEADEVDVIVNKILRTISDLNLTMDNKRIITRIIKEEFKTLKKIKLNV